MALKDEIKKREPFASPKQEALLGILRTSDLLENRVARVLRGYELTMSQYNVLRILRGEGKPLPTIEVAARMIQVAPAITRVIDQLSRIGLVDRSQAAHDGRVFLIQLTKEGVQLLKKMYTPVNQIHEDLMTGIPDEELRLLNGMLSRLRGAIPE